MEIIVDECLAESTRLVLKEAGFKIINVEDIINSGVEDDKIFEYGTNHKIPNHRYYELKRKITAY
ncbi:MAG: hypothetical protein ACTSWH_07880 [Promethearchaeota archaeon]